MKILIVEDMISFAKNLQTGFEHHGFEVEISHTGEDAFFRITSEVYDLIVLDWMLPERDGLETLKQIRSMKNWTPVIMLTAKDTVEDRVKGLEMGADDYLTKPFAFAELLARVNSHLRRKTSYKEPNSFTVGDLFIDTENRTATRQNVNLRLTQKEYEILLYLCRHKEQTITRHMLTRDVWKIETRATPMDSVIDVHINRLRKKVDVPFKSKMIATVRGIGFRLEC